MAYIGYEPAKVPLTSADITDGIITSAKIADGTIVNADINASAAIASTKLSGVANTPAFMSYRISTQTISTSTFTKIQFSTEVFDTDNCYDNATNYRFTPTTAGKYFINFNLGFQSWIQEKYYFIYKNGAASSLGVINNNVGSISAIVNANGSTDYFEAYVYQASGSSQTIDFSDARNNFFAYKLIGV